MVLFRQDPSSSSHHFKAVGLLGRHIGKPPWGYKLFHESDEGKAEDETMMCGRLVPHPDKWPDVLKLWEMATNKSTPMKIAAYLNLHGVPSPSGKEWTDRTVRYILKNSKYYGQLFRGINPESRLPGPKENAQPIILEDDHERAVEYKDWLRINQDIKKRHRSHGATRCHSSPNPLSGRMKCGNCSALGFDSNLEIYRREGIIRLRCSRKKHVGGYDCGFKGAKLNQVLEEIWNKLKNHFLNEDTLKRVVDEIAEESRGFLKEQEPHRSGINARKKIVMAEIGHINDVLKEAGRKAPNLRSLIDDLANLEKEKGELEEMTEQVAQLTEESLLFVNDKTGIIETALNLKTITDPADPDALRELFHIFVERVEIFECREGSIYQQGIIHYDLPVCQGEAANSPSTDTIHLQKRKAPASSKSCGFDTSTPPRGGCHNVLATTLDKLRNTTARAGWPCALCTTLIQSPEYHRSGGAAAGRLSAPRSQIGIPPRGRGGRHRSGDRLCGHGDTAAGAGLPKSF